MKESPGQSWTAKKAPSPDRIQDQKHGPRGQLGGSKIPSNFLDQTLISVCYTFANHETRNNFRSY
jgi:hypothetical protein